jgi:hypothetical protein
MRWPFGPFFFMPTVSHSPAPLASLWKFKLHHYPYCLQVCRKRPKCTVLLSVHESVKWTLRQE